MKLGEALNEAFGHVYVKNLPKATLRERSFKNTANLINLKYELFRAISGNSYVPKDYLIKYRPECYPNPHNQYLAGNFCTSMAILLDAMKNDYDSYVICDDDTVFYNIECESLLPNLPKDWDILILGQMLPVPIDTTQTVSVDFTRVQTADLPGCHCIVINKKLYWKQLVNYMGFDQHGRFGDVTVGDMSMTDDIKVYYAATNLCYQERELIKPYTIDQTINMTKRNKFKIIVASYNNEDWVEYNLASILNQTYDNYSVVYVDDCSTDNTSKLVHEMVGSNDKFTIIRNDTNLGADGGAIYNYVRFYESLEDDEICVSMCGDDWLIDDNVLENLNRYYNEKDVWMSYGQFYVYDGTDNAVQANPQNTPYPDFVHKYKIYRKDVWRASHLLTFRGFLAKAIDLEDIKSMYDGKWFYHAPDLAVAYPCLEMCPQDRIGVVDFPTYMWNASEQCQTRTRARETGDNIKYEEIRNKKHYKEGLSGEKMPQINAFGGSRENNSMPSEFSYVYNLTDGEFDMTIFADMAILDYLKGEIAVNRGKIVADIHEPPYLFTQQQVYDAVYDNYDKFDRILTYDERLLTLPNAVFRNGGYECVLNKNIHTCEYPTLADKSMFMMYDKSKRLSFITSNKTFTDGHKFRVSCVDTLRAHNSRVDIFGVGYNMIPAKIDGLKDYKYSIAIENGVYKNYFTEKILDCFLTGTIPIYKGCTNLGDFFNMDGVIVFETQEELLEIVAYLENNDYSIPKDALEDNYLRALKYQYDNDGIYNKFLKDLIKK